MNKNHIFKGSWLAQFVEFVTWSQGREVKPQVGLELTLKKWYFQ